MLRNTTVNKQILKPIVKDILIDLITQNDELRNVILFRKSKRERKKKKISFGIGKYNLKGKLDRVNLRNFAYED